MACVTAPFEIRVGDRQQRVDARLGGGGLKPSGPCSGPLAARGYVCAGSSNRPGRRASPSRSPSVWPVRRPRRLPSPSRSALAAMILLAAAASPWSRCASAGATATQARTGLPPRAYSCPIFPADNALNRDISQTPLDPNSASYIGAIGAGLHLHADFGTNPSYGIPYTVVARGQPKVPISFSEFGG